ncbi:MAG: S-adenosylmethionine:tRNA ribosyltransferase-isomerase, partial [Desulfovibrio sp.]|nr:S-adenosylmethionine:tRNA ribosyltransferase-isomerase [Desulfovibrio sp.]
MKESLQEQEDFLLASYQYDLPTAQIAQFPTKERGSSRLMVLRRGPKNDYPPAITHATISELANFLPKGALLVANNSKVMPARLLGTLPSGGKLEVLLLSPLPLLKAKPEPCLGADYFSAEAEVLTRSSARLKIGAELEVNPRLKITILK